MTLCCFSPLLPKAWMLLMVPTWLEHVRHRPDRMLKKETGVLHFQGLAHYTGWWICLVYKFCSYHLQPYLTWAWGDVSRAKIIFQAVDVSGKILHGSSDYAYTVNGTSANSILLVKLFYTLEPHGPTKVSGRLLQRRSRSDGNIDLFLRQHIPQCGMCSLCNGFQCTAWTDFFQSSFSENLICSWWETGTGRQQPRFSQVKLETLLVPMRCFIICTSVSTSAGNHSSALITEDLEVTKARSPSERQFSFQGSSQCHGWKLGPSHIAECWH